MNAVKSSPIPKPPERAWHALDWAHVAEALETNECGLSPDDVQTRLAQYGPNQIKEAPMPGLLSLLLRQFKSPLIVLLAVAATVSLLLQEVIDAGVIAAVIIIDVAIGFIQERRAEVSIRSLARLAAPKARVVRAGMEEEIESRDLVPGDVVLVESGTRVPADIRLARTTSLMVDESLLTGESVPVAKSIEPVDVETQLADRHNMVFAGTIVTSGRGRGLVTATGATTEMGAIATTIQTADQRMTPLQLRLGQLSKIISVAVIVAAGVIFLTGILLGNELSEMLTIAVAAAVSAIPEGLLIAYTITLAVGVRRMAARNAIVRRLPSVETLGSTSVIGSDKTGTLTENRMTVQTIWSAGRSATIIADGTGQDLTTIEARDPLRLTLLAGVLSNEATIVATEDGYDTTGDPTEGALLVAAARLGVDPHSAREDYRLVSELPFEPERQYSAAVREHGEQTFLFVKGAPERLIAMCDSLLMDDGPVPLDPEVVHQAGDRLAARGLRVLAMAYRFIPSPVGGSTLEPKGLTLLGLQGMQDPPREHVREAVASCQEAGIRVVMITGDHAETARAIAGDLGIAGQEARVITGTDLDQMHDDALRTVVSEASVYARVTPDHKLRVVQALQRLGEVVAVTGDGVNDAPALRASDVGIAMGRSGTDVAREAADMVLADDNFVSIFSAVEQGRIVFSNIRKVTFFLVSTGVAEIIAIMTALLLGWPLPFLAAQIIWLNLVTNGFQDVALAFEPGERGILNEPPRPREAPILSRHLLERVILSGVVMALGTLVLFNWSRGQSDSLIQAQSVALTTMVIFQAFQVGNSRSEHQSLFRMSPFSNPFLFLATAGAVAVHVGALYFPLTQTVLRIEPVTLITWPLMIGAAASILVAVESHKAMRRRLAARMGQSKGDVKRARDAQRPSVDGH